MQRAAHGSIQGLAMLHCLHAELVGYDLSGTDMLFRFMESPQ